MCGIAGVIGRDWTHHDFDLLFESIQHRGPDRSGIFRSDDIQLGMHRLRLRGPDTTLPIVIGDAITVFNGQIYGTYDHDDAFRELPAGITQETAAVITNGHDVDGMYASCIVATDDGPSVALTTDPQFIKPLFIRGSERGFAFCSEFAPLLRISATNVVDREALAELFTYGWYLSDQSWVSDIRLAWKHDITISRTGMRELPKRHPLPVDRSDDDIARLKHAIRDSVQRCVAGSGPFGLAISGGLDSTILAWELNAAGVEDLTTLSIRLKDSDDGVESLDELGLPPGGAWETWSHRTFTIADEEDFLSAFEAATTTFGQPSTMSSLPLYQHLAELASDEGIRVLLTGEGVDELFCGYRSYSKLSGLASILDYYHDPRRDRLVRTLFGNAAIDRTQTRFSDLYGVQTDIRQIEREIRLVRLLLRSDVCLMAKSIEGRVPFLHNRIPEMALAIPWQELAPLPGKMILRQAYRNELGIRATAEKTRFKASDAMLARCIEDKRCSTRIHAAASQLFGSDAVGECLQALATDAGFDADICCLLISLTFLIEHGVLDGHTG